MTPLEYIVLLGIVRYEILGNFLTFSLRPVIQNVRHLDPREGILTRGGISVKEGSSNGEMYFVHYIYRFNPIWDYSIDPLN